MYGTELAPARSLHVIPLGEYCHWITWPQVKLYAGRFKTTGVPLHTMEALAVIIPGTGVPAQEATTVTVRVAEPHVPSV